MSFIVKVQAPTGTATLVAKVRRDSDGFFYDFGDATFKAAGHVTPQIALAEPDAANFPGLFQSAAIGTSLPQWSDGTYTAMPFDTVGTLQFNPIELVLRGGLVQGVDQAGEVQGLVRLNAAGDIEVTAWLLVAGQVHPSPTSCTVNAYTTAGALFFGPLVDAAADAQGIFRVEQLAAAPADDTGYYAVASVVAGGVTYSSVIPFVVY